VTYGNRSRTPFRRRTTTTRKFPVRRRSSSKLEGGTYYDLTIVDLPPEGNEIVAPAVGVVVLSNSHWTDWQWNEDNQENRPELELNPIVFAGGYFECSMWVAGGSADGEVYGIGQLSTAYLMIPYVLSFGVFDERDPVGAGDPDDIVPSCVPNYFLRDYGREETSLIQTHYQESPWARAPRVLHRHFGTLDGGKVNASWIDPVGGDLVLGTGWRKNHTFRVKRHVLARRQALYIFLRAYNSDLLQYARIGFQVTGHFGYRRLQQR